MNKRSTYIITSDSLRTLYELYFDSLCSYLRYYTNSVEIIEEIVQDIFVNLWEERNDLEIIHIKTYLFTASRYRIYNHLRNRDLQRRKLGHWMNEELEKLRHEEIVDLDEFSEYLQTAVEELPPRCKEIYQLSRDKKLTYKQIADIKNISIKTVEAQMSIALQKLKSSITQHYKIN